MNTSNRYYVQVNSTHSASGLMCYWEVNSIVLLSTFLSVDSMNWINRQIMLSMVHKEKLTDLDSADE